ncbi:MAG: cation-transporting P-type ATPase [Oscillospiraceae bacterium]
MKQKSKQPYPRVYRQIPMLQADPAEGLSPQETKLRQSNGLSNIMPPSNTKSEGQIIKENVLTFFNLIFLVLALCLCLVGSFKNLMFLLVAAANTVVGSFQEIRAKRAVDKLTLVAAGTAKAIRSASASPCVQISLSAMTSWNLRRATRSARMPSCATASCRSMSRS